MSTQICCGCLCSGRKMTTLDNFSEMQYFLQILNEIPVKQQEILPLWVCWECCYYTKKFIKFKERVKNCFQKLHEHATEIPTYLITPTLQIQRLFNIDITKHCAGKTGEFHEIIKSENLIEHPEIHIKHEAEDLSMRSDTNLSDVEDLPLIALTNKNLVKKVKKRKRKKLKNTTEHRYVEIDLSIKEIENEMHSLRNADEFMNAIFKCVRCITPFPNSEDLQDHITKKHDLNASKHRCPICECSFSNEVSYNYHRMRHSRRYRCSVCLKRFTSKCKAGRHYEMYHCGGAREKVASQEPITKQDAASAPPTAPTSFPCSLCEKTFKWKTSLRKHVETHRIQAGESRRPYCETCRLSFTSSSNLQKHLKNSSKHQIQLKLNALSRASGGGEAARRGDEGGGGGGEDVVAAIKLAVASSRRLLSCEQCGRRFQWRGNLQRHLRSHLARSAGELVCVPCDRTFSSIATYHQHLKISKKHVSEDDYKHACSQCDKRFASRTRLREHIDWEHLKNYVNTCLQCQKVFKSQTSLYLHTKVVHNKDSAEHLCDHCGKAFPNGAKLRSHVVALHSGSSPYRCGECGARFNWHSCLSRHVRVLHGAGAAGKKRRDVTANTTDKLSAAGAR